MTDYICCGKVVPETVAQIVKGIAEACVEAGTALVGGETAEHPGLLKADEYDIAGASTGVVEAEELLGAERVRAGDVVVAMASSGLHSNGYSLVRHVFFDRAGWQLDRDVPDLGGTLGDTLLVPTRVYAKHCLELIADLNGVDEGKPLHAMSHITGGGFAANLARVIPDDLAVRVDRGSWTPAPIFGLVGRLGDVPLLELEKTLNMGVGMVAVLDPAAADRAIDVLAERDVAAWVCGEVSTAGTTTPAGVELQGTYGH
jgi:phosphoribosylformylglycinamidine cyclo-ligase